MKFVPDTLDYDLSPYTGMTRQSWMEAAAYLLTGIFQNMKSMSDPVIMPRQETVVSYPNKHTPERKKRAEVFEGLARSFFIAAPLIHNEPDMKVCNYSIRDYYKTQVLKICTKGDPNYVLDLQEILNQETETNPFAAYQQTVECGALVICLWICRAEIWDTYSKEERDTIAGFLSGYAHGNTVPQNWRLFNMLGLAFLQMEGYPIDQDIMRDHAQAILSYYAGAGWYRDGHAFDYYSCWAFNVYAPIWNLWYGYEHEPYLAQKFEEYSNELMHSYDAFFDAQGHMIMWGRSNIYRNATTSAFEGNLLLNHPAVVPGLARRISSGALLQFLGREDFLWQGVPTLGYYGQFTPLVQSYSCAESPFWLGKVFLCLHLPKEHPFWTEKECNGFWETAAAMETKITTLDGPGLCISNHQASGEAVLRTGKVLVGCGDEHAMWNYAKLSYNSKFPWESSVNGEVESQQYVLKDLTFQQVKKCNITLWSGERDGVLYRRQFFDYTLAEQTHWMNAVNLADFTVPYGIMRVDKLRCHQRPISLTLGAYGFPDNGTAISRYKNGMAKAVVLKGHDFAGKEKQLAMTIYDSWDNIAILRSQGTNPDSEHSIVLYGELSSGKQYGYENYVLISQVITKSDLDDFSEDELFPVKSIEYTDQEGCGGYGPIAVYLKNGQHRNIDFEGVEGNLQL